MLKKFLSGIIGTVILFCLTTISVAYIAKSILNGPLLMELGNGIISDSFEEINGQGIINYTDLIFAGTSSEYPDIEKYFDEEQIKNELGDIFIDYVKYSVGIPDAKKPNTESLSLIINNCAEKYEQGTGKTMDLTIPNTFLTNLTANLEKEGQVIEPKIKKVLEIIYSDNVYMIPTIIIIISVILLLLINRDLAYVLIKLGKSLIMNAIGTFGLGYGLKIAINQQGLMNDFTAKIVAIFVKEFNKIATICLIAGITLLLSGFIIKALKKKKEPDNNINDNNINNNNMNNNNQFITYNY